MNCHDMKRELSALFPGALRDPLPEPIRRHLEECVPCRAWFGQITRMQSRLDDMPSPAGPDPSYWTTMVPRIRARIETGRQGRESSVGRIAFSLPGALVLLFFLYFMATLPPREPGLDDAFSSLSGSELYDLQQAEKYTGLLGVYDNSLPVNGGNSLTDFIVELIAENPSASYLSALNPGEVIEDMNEEEFSEFINQIGHEKSQ